MLITPENAPQIKKTAKTIAREAEFQNFLDNNISYRMNYQQVNEEMEIQPVVKPKDQPIFGTHVNQWPVSIQNGEVIYSGSGSGLEFPMEFNKIYVITKHQDPKNLDDIDAIRSIPSVQSKIYDGNGNKMNIVMNLGGCIHCHDNARDAFSMENCNIDFKHAGQTVVYEIRLCTKHRKFVTDQGIILPIKTELFAKDPHTRQMTKIEFQKIVKSLEKEMNKLNNQADDHSAQSSSAKLQKNKKKLNAEKSKGRDISKWDDVE